MTGMAGNTGTLLGGLLCEYISSHHLFSSFLSPNSSFISWTDNKHTCTGYIQIHLLKAQSRGGIL